ncbi:hypothetical protein F2Q69_00053379 [Brassica cretica]|uniref:Peptidase A2 domain-containing protein n=1 Tax=Brassica cretica TaxID=69181 RepID=A0A8S9MZ55_BRACR|nr:hypothetical protein F2Q69_00053379 [Brassica cretica]
MDQSNPQKPLNDPERYVRLNVRERHLVQGGATADRAKPRNDLLVIKLTIRDIDVARMLIDTGCSADIIFKETPEMMGIDQFELVKYHSPLLGLSEETTMAYGSINLTVKARTVTRVTDFLVVDRPASYNVIMGMPWLNAMRAIPSTCVTPLTKMKKTRPWGHS